jgi:hypothetical protein
MVAEVIKTFRYLPLLLALVALPSRVAAHQLDEYLQATIVAIEPGEIRFQINLTPGIAVAEQVLGLIDRNGDGMISTNESAAYAELVKRDLVVRLDRRSVELKLARSYFPEPAELRTGWGIIQMEYSCKANPLGAGPHKLTLENRHMPGRSVYLFNAAQSKSAAVQITEQKRNENQSIGEIAFEFYPAPQPSKTLGIVASPAEPFPAPEALGLGALVLLPSILYLFRGFKTER